MNTTLYGNPTQIKKTCEWTGKEFYVDWKHRNQKFIDKKAMYEWRKSQNREKVPCLNCGELFERYKRILHPKTGKPTQYCSNECNRTSEEKKQNLKNWGISDKNHWNKKECQIKCKTTKLEKYGDENYNNMEKNKQTCLTKYGVPYSVYLPNVMSNGKRISNFQKRVYEKLLETHPDAKLECYMKNVEKSVDIFIPSKHKIVECHGDYWHCNPYVYDKDYFHKKLNKYAKEVWEQDLNKENSFVDNGFSYLVFWELDWNVNNNFFNDLNNKIENEICKIKNNKKC
jgi:G:T-mismatch repair DNA endonuclease (very short patch repair protein)